MKPGAEAHLDVAHLESPDALHTAMAFAFGFPEYYGRNWDAFDECISETQFRRIEVSGIAFLIDTLPGKASLLKRCLMDHGSRSGTEIVIK